MSRLASINKQRVDDIVNAENEHEKRALNCRLSPLAEFVIENIQDQVSVSFTAAGSQLIEAACVDWLEINGHDISSDQFKAKYRQWLESFDVSKQEEHDDTSTGEILKFRTRVFL